jgi:hypothetical protein
MTPSPAQQPQRFIRVSFISLNSNRLYTAGQVADLIEQHSPHTPTPSQPARLACIIDLHAYQHGNTLFEDIRACSGESCNYCGRYQFNQCSYWKNNQCSKPIITVDLFEKSIEIAKAATARAATLAARHDILKGKLEIIDSEIEKFHKPDLDTTGTAFLNGLLYARTRIFGSEQNALRTQSTAAGDEQP